MLKAKPMTLLQIENVLLLVINMSQKLGSARVHLTSMLKLMKDSANLSGGNTRKVTVGFARAMDPME